jgi:hypothetical protein
MSGQVDIFKNWILNYIKSLQLFFFKISNKLRTPVIIVQTSVNISKHYLLNNTLELVLWYIIKIQIQNE